MAGLVVIAVPALAHLVGGPSISVVLVAAVLGLAWQVWLSRTGIVATEDALLLRGLVGTQSVPLSTVRSFDVERRQSALDLFDREINLVIRCNGVPDVVCRWVAWQDLLTPLFVVGERPLPTPSQQRVLDRLAGHLSRVGHGGFVADRPPPR